MANDFQDKNGVGQGALVNGKGDVISAPSYLRWLAQGKVFDAGYGAEDTATDSSTSLTANGTAPTFALKSPAAHEPIIVPILLKLFMTADGGTGATTVQVAFTKPARLCATVNTLTGTAFKTKHCLYQTNPPQTEQAAQALYTCTSANLVAADYVVYDYKMAILDTLTLSLIALGEGPTNVHTLRFLQEGVPHLMTQGAAMLVYCVTGTASTWIPYMQWAELELADLV